LSSAASALNSIAGPLLGEINAALSAAQVPSLITSLSIAASGGGTSDGVNLSEAAQFLWRLEELQNKDSVGFAKLTAGAASQLLQAAQQAIDPMQVSILSSLAEKFQAASQSGNLSPFSEDASSNPPSSQEGNQNPDQASTAVQTSSGIAR
jgi:hypothetical protein